MVHSLFKPSWLLVGYAAMLLILLLTPFDFYTQNSVQWKPEVRALEFSSPGIVRSLIPPRRLHRDLTSGSGFALEVWLSTRRPDQTGPARIVSYSRAIGARNFMLGQRGTKLVVRLRTTRTDRNGLPQLEVEGVFTTDRRRHVVITYDFHSLCAYVDGQREACRKSPEARLANWDSSHHLLFGNETTGDRPWLGALFLVALYDRALLPTEIAAAYRAAAGTPPTRPAAGDGLVAFYGLDDGSGDIVRDATPRDPIQLAIPRFVEQRRHGFLSRDSTLSAINVWSVADVTLNVLMFVPFGFLGSVVLRSRGWARAASSRIVIGSAAAFTLGVETVQYFLVSRTSQLEDVLLNLLGAAVGLLFSTSFDGSPSRRQHEDDDDRDHRDP